MARWFREHTALVEGLCSVPSTRVNQLKITCNSSSKWMSVTSTSVTSMDVCDWMGWHPIQMDVCDFHGRLRHVNIPPNIHIIFKYVLIISTKQVGSHLPSEPALLCVSLFLIHIELPHRGQGDGSVGKGPFHVNLMI